MSVGVRPLDFTELCTNYPPPRSHYSSSSSYESGSESDASSCCDDVIPPYQAAVIRDYTDGEDDDSSVFYTRRFSSSSTISSDFRNSLLSISSVSTAISDDELFCDKEPLYENRSEKSDHHTYQNIDDFRGKDRTCSYENVKLRLQPAPSHYENMGALRLSLLPRPRPSSLSIDYQTPRPVSTTAGTTPRRTVEVIRGPVATTSSYRDLRTSVTPQASRRVDPDYSECWTPGFDPCARKECPPPSYYESVENLRHMEESLRDVDHGLARLTNSHSFQDLRRSNSQLLARPKNTIQRSTSQNFHQLRKPGSQSRPVLKHSMSQNFQLSNPRSRDISESLQQLSKLLDEKFMSENLPGSEESLCRLRYPSNTTSNQNSVVESRDVSIANDSAGIESIGNDSSISSPRCCKPWEAETVSLDR